MRRKKPIPVPAHIDPKAAEARQALAAKRIAERTNKAAAERDVEAGDERKT